MDTLITQIVQRTGISEQQAREAVQTVLGYAQDKLPPMVVTQLTAVLNGTDLNDVGAQAQQLLGGLGGMFSKK